MVRVMWISVVVFSIIVSCDTATCAVCTRGTSSVMTVSAVATKTTVRLSLIESTGRYLIGIARRVVHRLSVFVLVVQSVCRLGVRVRVLPTDLCVNWRWWIFLILMSTIVLGGIVLRILCVTLCSSSLPWFFLVVATILCTVMLQWPKYRYALVRIFFETSRPSFWHLWDEIWQSVGHRWDGLLSLTCDRSHTCYTWK